MTLNFRPQCSPQCCPQCFMQSPNFAASSLIHSHRAGLLISTSLMPALLGLLAQVIRVELGKPTLHHNSCISLNVDVIIAQGGTGRDLPPSKTSASGFKLNLTVKSGNSFSPPSKQIVAGSSPVSARIGVKGVPALPKWRLAVC